MGQHRDGIFAGLCNQVNGTLVSEKPYQEPNQIKLEEVMKALRPKLQEDTRTDLPALAGLIDNVWSEIEGSFQSTLRDVSLASLCDRARDMGITEADTATEGRSSTTIARMMN
jgi:hypothetical protein